MATLNEITFNILNTVRGGRSNTHEHISERQIHFIIHQYRAFFLKRELDKKRDIDSSFEQTIPCLDLIAVDKSACPLVIMGCEVKRTKDKVPTIVRTNRGPAISFFGSIDQITDVQVVSPSAVRWNKYNTYTGKKAKAYEIGDYFYVDENCGLEKVSLRAVFQDPEELSALGCFDPDEEYPFPADLVPVLVAEILRVEFNIMPMAPNDTSNDKVQN